MGLIRQIIINAFRPWTAALTGDASYELSILAWFVFFVVLRKCVLALPTKSWALREVVRRPTVVPVLMHSLVTTLAAFAVLARWQDDTIFVWRRLVMPFSCAYWLFDLAFYCWPKSDLLIAVHHIAILICNYPVGDNAGAAALAEIHPQCNTVLCSANGYTLEATTFLLYARWLLANTLTRHHWSYYAISALLLGLWVSLRLLYVPYFLVAHMGPACPLASPLAVYALTGYATYTLMVIMSAVWLMQLLKNGVNAFLVLEQSAASSLQNSAVINFGAQRKSTSVKRA